MGETDARAALDRHRDELLQLPGTVGTAIGLDEGGNEVIHVYVRVGTSPDPVREAAQRVLGEAPVQVMPMEMPEAD
ncbi:MAG: hypothetical protein ACRDH1_01350 [Actinomycetota bacterium]